VVVTVDGGAGVGGRLAAGCGGAGLGADWTVVGADRYGRTVGRVYVGNVDVNAEMIRQGAAWVYRQYLKDQSLLALEQQAKAAKRGLWGLPETDRCPP